MKYLKELTIAIEASLLGGREIIKIYSDPNSDFGIERKADNSPLTIADKAAHKAIEEILSRHNLPILSEEGREIKWSERSEWRRFWLVDPLDGTKEFIKRNGEFTVNVALIEDGQANVGVIYVPVKRVLYFGAVGFGAFKVENVETGADFASIFEQATKLPNTKNREANNIIVVASRSHLSVETEEFIEQLKSNNTQVTLISSGSSLKLCLVAEGSADYYPRYAPTMEWDTAAGDAIAVASGCMVVKTDGRTPLRYNKENLLNPWFIVKRE